MKVQKIIIIIVSFLSIIMFGLWLAKGREAIPVQDDSNISSPSGFATSTQGLRVYKNTALGLKFEYPAGWYVDSDHLGQGTLQLFNYDVAAADGKSIFPKGSNKIEAIITDDSNIVTSSDYPEKSRQTTAVEVAGKQATRIHILLEGSQMLVYVIPIASQKSVYLRMIIYGDPHNFSVLDDVVKSIEWTNL